jgi:2-succinyl-6-hydroxy-2,4-cyclohexadiene-1-carboxylate synthase
LTGRPSCERLDVEVGGGLRLHIARAGSGPPLVLLHGFTGSNETWATHRAALSARHTTLAVDLPGHGHSGAPDDATRYALDRFADDMDHMLDALQVQRAAMLGYSLGGRAALRFALRHPGRVAALVLESASPGVIDPVERAARLRSDAARADAIERDGVARFVEQWERLPLWASQACLPDATRARLREQRLANDPRGLANSLRGAGAGADPPVLVRLGTHQSPVLLIAGALDTKYVLLGRLMEEAMPDARLAVVPDAGHAVHLEQPAAFEALVTGFLDGLPSAGAVWQ